MKREQAAAVVTALVIVGVAVTLALRASGRTSTDSAAKPSAVVFELYERAGKGDARGYLACFTPELRQTVESSRSDMGEPAFRQYLLDLGRAVKGVSVTEERSGSGEARLRVELVYADRAHNDVHSCTVVRRGGRWLIASMSGAQALKMPIPYGTPAYPLEPAGGETTEEGSGEEGAPASANTEGGGG